LTKKLHGRKTSTTKARNIKVFFITKAQEKSRELSLKTLVKHSSRTKLNSGAPFSMARVSSNSRLDARGFLTLHCGVLASSIKCPLTLQRVNSGV
jgi:hypothetical protein